MKQKSKVMAAERRSAKGKADAIALGMDKTKIKSQ
jgi:hypothetical protein